MFPTRKPVTNPVSAATSTASITSGQNAALSQEIQHQQNCPGSFTCCQQCGLPTPCEISDSDIAALLDFFLILDRLDREADAEAVFVTAWEQF